MYVNEVLSANLLDGLSDFVGRVVVVSQVFGVVEEILHPPAIRCDESAFVWAEVAIFVAVSLVVERYGFIVQLFERLLVIVLVHVLNVTNDSFLRLRKGFQAFEA